MVQIKERSNGFTAQLTDKLHLRPHNHSLSLSKEWSGELGSSSLLISYTTLRGEGAKHRLDCNDAGRLPPADQSSDGFAKSEPYPPNVLYEQDCSLLRFTRGVPAASWQP